MDSELDDNSESTLIDKPESVESESAETEGEKSQDGIDESNPAEGKLEAEDRLEMEAVEDETAEEAAGSVNTEEDTVNTEEDTVNTEEDTVDAGEDTVDAEEDTVNAGEDNVNMGEDNVKTEEGAVDMEEDTVDAEQTDDPVNNTNEEKVKDDTVTDKEKTDTGTADKDEVDGAADVNDEDGATQLRNKDSKKRHSDDDEQEGPSEKRLKTEDGGGDSDTLGATSDVAESKSTKESSDEMVPNSVRVGETDKTDTDKTERLASPSDVSMETEQSEAEGGENSEAKEVRLKTKTESTEETVPADSVSVGETDKTDTDKTERLESPSDGETEQPKTDRGENSEAEDKNDVKPDTQESSQAVDRDMKTEDRDMKTEHGAAEVKEGMISERVTVNGKADEDEDSAAKSDDSEKENINTDLPMDLSTKSSAPSDIITLSDESSDEDGRMNGISNGIVPEMTPEEIKMRRKLVKKLQSELRNEEAKLVLLKKMRQSQATQQLQDHSNFSSRDKQPPMKAHAGQPPPLIRGGQSGGMSSKPQPSQSMSSHVMRGQPIHHMRGQMQGPPPLVMAPRMGSHMVPPTGLRGGLPPGAAPPNIMPGFRGQLHQQAQAHSQQLAAAQQQVDNQTPAQRQAAAKLALRKQLEKTLLQIPPPKPPPPEMNFIPSLISNEFIMLVGLEEVVNYITDADLIARGEKSPDEKLVCTPFTCIQCDTDFTPVWKREKPGSKNVICEMCVTTNQKKALKQEHTNRLKSAFVKALQQEQEIERMQSQGGVTVTTTPATVAPPTTAVNLTAPSYKSSAHAAAAEQLRHHQNFIQAHQAHQAHLRATQPIGIPTFNPRNPFHYQTLPFKHSDLQRQYLLDMIPPRSMAQSNVGWKS